MPEKIYLYLLILCGIWSRGIIETFADEEIKEPSRFLVRQKRVVSHVPVEDNPVSMRNASYVVIIKHFMRIHCVGSILSNHVVITAASCVRGNPEEYQITSGENTSNRGTNNNVIEIRRHFRIALLIVGYPFIYSQECYYIKLHEEPLLSGIVGKVSGWGYNFRSTERGTDHPTKLRSIEVPILSHRDCVNRYRQFFVITEKEVCTYHQRRHCGHTDFGAGLVVDGYLAGVHFWTGLCEGRIDPNFPDVFAVLQHSGYNQWIRTNLQNISVQYQNRQHPLLGLHS